MIIAAILAFLVLAWFVSRMVKRKGSGMMDVTDLKKRIDAGENLLIVDLRDEPEFKKGHIAGAVNIPIGEFESRIGEVENTNKRLTLICTAQGRSMKAHGILAGRNIEAAVVRGGMDQWGLNAFPTEH